MQDAITAVVKEKKIIHFASFNTLLAEIKNAEVASNDIIEHNIEWARKNVNYTAEYGDEEENYHQDATYQFNEGQLKDFINRIIQTTKTHAEG